VAGVEETLPLQPFIEGLAGRKYQTPGGMRKEGLSTGDISTREFKP
jgi:hypothetical protein